MAGLSRKHPGHHLESSNMDLVIEIPYRNYPSSVQYSLKWELHPAKTIVSCKHEVIFHLHEKKPKFHQLIGRPNPFKTTTTERSLPLLSATPSPLLLPAQRLASGESQVRSRFSWRSTAKCTESVCLTVQNLRRVGCEEVRTFLNVFLIPFLSRCKEVNHEMSKRLWQAAKRHIWDPQLRVQTFVSLICWNLATTIEVCMMSV